MEGVSPSLAFAAGLASFMSPCVLPVVPAYLVYLAGNTEALATGVVVRGSPRRGSAAVNGLLFVVGFGAVFVALGATAAGLGAFLRDYLPFLRRLGGVVVVMLGLHTAGILRLFILDGERRLQPPPPDGSPWRAFLLGATFSAGWTPCIGPVLASILVLASGTASWERGVILLSAYAAGLGLPFVALSLGVTRATGWLARLRPYAARVQTAGGLLLVGLGVMVYADAFTWLNSVFPWGF